MNIEHEKFCSCIEPSVYRHPELKCRALMCGKCGKEFNREFNTAARYIMPPPSEPGPEDLQAEQAMSFKIRKPSRQLIHPTQKRRPNGSSYGAPTTAESYDRKKRKKADKLARKQRKEARRR